MTDAELKELLKDCPTLYHMAEAGSWDSIKSQGLLSTSALLDLYDVKGDARTAIEAQHRPDSVTITSEELGKAVVRDQKPMSDSGLVRALKDGLTPTEWYKTLNSKVFFWLTEERLNRLLGARAYRDKEQDVLVLNTKTLLEAHRDKIWFCPMNSGNTKPYPWPRGQETFQRIENYPYDHWRKKRKAGERVVELCVDHQVADITDHVIEVRRMEGSNVKDILFTA